MDLKFCVLLVLASVHGAAIADDASFSLAGDHIVSRSLEDASEVTITGNALLKCDLDPNGRMLIKADKLVVKVPTTRPDAPAVPEFVAQHDCQLTADDIEIKSTGMVADKNSDGVTLRIKFSGDIEIKFKNGHLTATAATLTHSRGKWKAEHLELKRFDLKRFGG